MRIPHSHSIDLVQCNWPILAIREREETTGYKLLLEKYENGCITFNLGFQPDGPTVFNIEKLFGITDRSNPSRIDIKVGSSTLSCPCIIRDPILSGYKVSKNMVHK